MNTETDVRGRRYYHCDSVGVPNVKRYLNISKASLGEFTAGILKHGGDVKSLFCMTPEHPRAWVCAVVLLKPEEKEMFEKETGFVLRDPPKICLN